MKNLTTIIASEPELAARVAMFAKSLQTLAIAAIVGTVALMVANKPETKEWITHGFTVSILLAALALYLAPVKLEKSDV